MGLGLGEFARNCESGWKGKIVRLYQDDGIDFAEMIGVDTLAQTVGYLTDEEALTSDDIQFHAIADLLPCKVAKAA